MSKIKAFADFVRILMYAMKTSLDGCHKVLRLRPVSEVKPCAEENTNMVVSGSLWDVLKNIFKPASDGSCFYDICIDAEILAEGLSSTDNCQDVELRVCDDVEEFDITDGKTEVCSTTSYADYMDGNGSFWLSLNGKEVNESSSPNSVTVIDNGGLACFQFSNPIGTPDEPCDVKAVLKYDKIIKVVTC